VRQTSGIEISSVSIRVGHSVFGVETTSEVHAVFADPRFQQMGYQAKRKRTPIPRIDRNDVVDER